MPLFAQAAGARLAYIAEEAASPSAQAILVSAESPIRTVADLKGKKVAITKGAGSHFLLLAALTKAGLSFKDISPAYLTPADGRTAFIGGNVPVRTGMTKVGLPGAKEGWQAEDGCDASDRHEEPGLRHRSVRQEPPGRPR